MGIVEVPLYDLSMTYIVAMRTKEGVLIASDGLIEHKNANKRTVGRSYDVPKIYDLTTYSVIGFAGAVDPDMEAYMDGQRSVLKQTKPNECQLVAQMVGYPTMRAFEPRLRRQNSDLEMLVVGYDLGSNGKPTISHIYFMMHSKGEKIFNATKGYIDIGYVKDVKDTLDDLYSKTSKGYKSLRKLAIKLVRQSAKLYPTGVGGNIYIKHVTKSGISDEVILYNKDNV